MLLRILIVVILCVAAVGGAQAAGRAALVIGNAKYEPAVGALKNTDNDARAVARTLRELGFTVTERQDVTREQLMRAVDDFRKTLKGAEVAVFYYAGHGISVGGANYLIPLKSGFDPAEADGTMLRMLAETKLFNAEQAVADMSAAGAGCNVVILDACRNTPVARDAKARSLAQGGLAEMTPPAGSLIAFATDAGRTASDGGGVNGLYTEELLKNLRTPGLTIEQVFKRTRAGVLARSDGAQVPAEYSRLVGEDIYLAGPLAVGADLKTGEAVAKAGEDKPGGGAPSVPDLMAVNKLAQSGETKACIDALLMLARGKGSGEFAVGPLNTLLERVKDTLRVEKLPKEKLEECVATCGLVLEALPQCLPLDDPQASALAAKAYNRKGDALLRLGRAEEALGAFDAAQPLAPNDAYILYNRGMARLALGMKDEARADFTAAGDGKFNQPGARRLALEALAGVK